MKIKDIIRKQTSIIALAVVLVAISVIGVSYAIFFDVKANSQNQVITAGKLKITISGVPTKATDSNALITVDSSTAKTVTYTIKNTESNLPAKYSLYLEINTTEELMGYIRIKKSSNEVYNDITELAETLDGKTYYKIDSGVIAAKGSSAQKTLSIWLDENSINKDIVYQDLNINLYVISEVDENQLTQ